MFGWLFNTLQHQLNAIEKEWRSENQTRKELKYDFLHRYVLQLARPLILCFVIGSFLLLILPLLPYFNPKHFVIFFVSRIDIPDPASYFSSLWSIQTAIAALVYPIVFSFVAFLTARRNNTKASLQIYLHDSNTLTSGISAFLLIAAMTLQYVFVPYISLVVLNIWIAFDTIWLLFNIGLTTHFLWCTFKFVNPSTRFIITQQYAVNVAWPREARIYISQQVFLNTVTKYSDNGTIIAGYTYDLFGKDKGVPAVTYIHNKKRQFIDVRFNLLAIATKRWLKRVSATIAEDTQGPFLVFPLSPYDINEKGEITLCRAKDGIPLSWYEHFLIHYSFVFRAVKENDLTINDILSDAQADALMSLRSGDSETFKEDVNRMLMLYESVQNASQVTDTSGSGMNFLQLSDPNDWFNKPVYRLWNRMILDLFDSSLSKLSQGEDYVGILIQYPNRLFLNAKEYATSEILIHYILLNTSLLWRIEGWWVQEVERQGQSEHDQSNPAVLKPPFYAIHEKVLKQFVGNWEYLKNSFIPHNCNDNWRDIQQLSVYLETHISQTIVMLFECILRGDRNAAEWLTDVLIKWFDELTSRFNGIDDYSLYQQPLITFEMMSKDWIEIEKYLKSDSFWNPYANKSLTFLAASIKHLWMDICCVAIYKLIVLGTNSKNESSLSSQIVSALIKGRPLRDGGGGVGKHKPYDDANELLISILRQYFADGHDRRGYRNRLDNYLERIADISKPEMVSGRIYSWMGSDDLNSVRDGQLLALMLAVSTEWKPNRKIEEIIAEWAKPANEKVREFQRMLGEWKSRISDASFLDNAESYNRLSKNTERSIEFESARLSLEHAIDHLLDVTARIHMEALTAASISEKRLFEIGQWASEKAFAKETAYFPVSLFGEITNVNESLNEISLKINGKNKGELTDPPMADYISSEKEWFAKTLRQCVSSRVLSSVIIELNPEKINADTPELYWSILSEYLNKANADGLHPILLLENTTIPYWLYNWIFPRFIDPDRSIPTDFVKTIDELLKSDEYICNINNGSVFNTPIPSGASILIVQESLDRIEFSRMSDGRYVNAVTKEVEDHPELVDLVLSWKMRISIKQYPSIRLNYGDKGLLRREEN